MRESGYGVQTTWRYSEWTSKRTRRLNKRDRAGSEEHDYSFLRLSRVGALSSFPEGQTVNDEFYLIAFRLPLALLLQGRTELGRKHTWFVYQDIITVHTALSVHNSPAQNRTPVTPTVTATFQISLRQTLSCSPN